MREFLMLAQVYNPDKHNIAGWFASEKKDGQRTLWDGGVTRGMATDQVPWANLDRGYRPKATGLWSRYGNVICAPDWFLDKLPLRVLLDGELCCGNLQLLRSIISTHNPDPLKWQIVKYLVFGSPGEELFTSDAINNPNFKITISGSACMELFSKAKVVVRSRQLRDVAPELIKQYRGKHLMGLEQVQLPDTESKAREQAYELLDVIVQAGGEGLMLADPRSFWVPKRTHTLLKMKPMLEGDALVTGIIKGKDRLEGVMGSLTCSWNGKVFNIGTGFTDIERGLSWKAGLTVAFKYVSLTNEGVPREARFSHIKTNE